MFFKKNKEKEDTKNDTTLRFDLKQMKKTKENIYLFPKRLENEVTNDILSLNSFLKEANAIIKIDGLLFNPKKILFEK